MADWNSWVITTNERVKHDAQFQFLKPTNGYVTGEQVKLFFLKSGLSPLVLGQIWTLADMDADGRLDKKEFSIAMFLIKKRLEGMQLPPTLPSGLKDDPQPVFVSSNQSSLSPLLTPNNSIAHKGSTNGADHLSLTSPAHPTLPSSDSFSAQNWVISASSRPKYRLLFNQHDRTKRGYITGVEARGIFLQSGLSQPILAHVWSLSDLDKDGNLNCDEFCIAAFLIEKALSGAPLPSSLPPGLLPSQPQKQGSPQISSTSPNVSRANNDEESKASALSFEDKRRENFRLGQAELDRRKQELAETLRKEEEMRLEKERREREQLEKARIEKERQQAAEAERQAERARELEAQREVRRRQAVEARTQAWRASEIERQKEAERQRVEGLKKEKSQVTAFLEQAMAHRASLVESVSAQERRRRELDARLMVAQNEVDSHKSAISEMRDKRDMYERDIRELTEQVEAAKAELTRWQREREQLSLRISTGVDTNPTAEQRKTLESNRELRQTTIQQLRNQLKQLDEGMTEQGQELASRRNKADDLERRSTRLQTELRGLRHNLEKKLQNSKRKNGSVKQTAMVSPPTDEGDTQEYEVMFDFNARHPDELNLVLGATVTVFLKPPVTVGPGWLYGEYNGKKGLFPESYVRKMVTGKIDPFDPFGVHKANRSTSQSKAPTIAEEPVGANTAEVTKPPSSEHMVSEPSRTAPPKILFTCIALYPYESTVAGDLNLAANDIIQVYTIRDDWWEGYSERTKLSGLFPANYTRKLTSEEERLLKQRNSLTESTVTTQVDWPDSTDAKGSFQPAQKPPGTSKVASAPSSPITCGGNLHPPNDANGGNATNGIVVTTKPEFARVIAPYTATTAGQLSLQPGQIVQLRKRSPKGWWEGELQQRGRVRQYGWFPADYVRLIEPSAANGAGALPNTHHSLPRNAESATAQKQLHIPAVTTTVTTQATPTDVVPTTSVSAATTVVASPSKSNVATTTAATTTATSQVSKTPNVAISAVRPGVEMMQAIFSYKAAHADELTFEEGAVITVIGRDEPEWWRGRLQSSGVEGLFPVNYVRPYNPASGTASKSSQQQQLIASKVTTNQPVVPANVASPSDPRADGLFAWMSIGVVRKRDHAVRELVETEDIYAKDLLEVYKVFYEPVCQSRLLTVTQLNSVFLNWMELYACSKSFVGLLKARLITFAASRSPHPPSLSVADILVEQLPKFRIYRQYCSRQENATETLQQYLTMDSRLNRFIQSCEQKTRTKGLPLSSYLLKPVQRVTKYKLLIERIYNDTGESSPDYDQISSAMRMITNLLDSINDAVKSKSLNRWLEWLRPRIVADNPESLNWLYAQKGNASDSVDCPERLLFYGTVYKAKSNSELIAFLFSQHLLLTVPTFSTQGRPYELPKLPGKASNNQFFKLFRQVLYLPDIRVASGSNLSTDAEGEKLYGSLSEFSTSQPAALTRTSYPTVVTTRRASSTTRSNVDSGSLNRHSIAGGIPQIERQRVFVLFHRSRPHEPFLSLKAPSTHDRDQWVIQLENAIARCLKHWYPKAPIHPGSPGLLLVTIIRAWACTEGSSNIRFELAVDDQPRQTYNTVTGLPGPQAKSAPMRFLYTPSKESHYLYVWAYDHMVWPKQTELGTCKIALDGLSATDPATSSSPGVSKTLSLSGSPIGLHFELNLKLA
ncbi:unnamed protein product [Calicophoron daubneyi]|uniref:Intersectin-1 n=1 Tax=Calicophoron daubneyi TaxID=300641 RepID=A0AAV2U0H5_CALDB